MKLKESERLSDVRMFPPEGDAGSKGAAVLSSSNENEDLKNHIIQLQSLAVDFESEIERKKKQIELLNIEQSRVLHQASRYKVHFQILTKV